MTKMDNLPVIQELHLVIKPYLKGDKLCSYDVSNLTDPGDNYGSVLISIHAQIQRLNGTLYSKNFVAKVPPTDPKYWQFIQPERTCLVENSIYKTLAPALKDLQIEAGIVCEEQFDGFADYCGSRISLDPNADCVDKDAILVLEDLRYSNFISSQRLNPLDLAQTHLALKYMAKFHALCIGLRLKKPEIFEMKIKPCFKKFDWHAAAPESKTTMISETLADIRKATFNDENMVELISKLSHDFFKFLTSPPIDNNAFNSIIHSDFWTMNLMFKYDQYAIPSKLKIIDFQTAQYDSVIHDLISFLLTSVSTEILENNYYNLIRFYYDILIETIASVGIVHSREYRYDAFIAELKRTAFIQVPHAIFMTRFILADDVTSQKKDRDLSQVLKNTSSSAVHEKLRQILRLAQKFEIL